MVVFLTLILTAPAAPVPKHKPPPPFTIIGFWKVNDWTLEFRKDGSYTSRAAPTQWQPVQPIYHGRWKMEGDELVIEDLYADTFAPNQHVHLTTHKSKITPNKDGLVAAFSWGNGQWKRVKNP